jgi:hypothetical protein
MRVRRIYPGLLALTLIGLIASATPALAQAPLGEADGFLAAVHDGDGSVAFRYRFEFVDSELLPEQALASTLRTALRYQTMQYKKLDFFIEMTNVADVGSGPYTKPGDELPPEKYPAVADPWISRVNQSWLRWSHDDGAAVGGRQNLVYDNARFVGNVGWRQTHQVYDSFRLDWTFFDKLDLRYTYIGQVHRVTGGEQDLIGNAVNAGFDLQKFGQLGAYAYMWDFASDPGAVVDPVVLSTNTFGGFWTGKYKVSEDKYYLKWRGEYAVQQDAYDNPNSVDANYMHFMGALGMKYLGVNVGYEQLSGSAEDGRFTTTFATLHKFNGWADRFLATPVEGLTDLYVGLGGKWEKLGYKAVWHKFDAESASIALGSEIDAEVSYKFDWGQMLALKGAFYTGDDQASDSTNPTTQLLANDVTKMWVYTTFTF